MRPQSSFQIVSNWSEIGKMTMRSQFAETISSSKFFEIAVLLLLSLVTGPNFMPISLLALE